MSIKPTQPMPPAREFASRVWNQLSQCVDDFINAWDEAVEPPSLAQFVPAEDADVRRLMLSELIKVDLEYRWREMRFPKKLEDYLSEFPELANQGLAPVDLVYEEYHVRRQSGDKVEPQDYYLRFPAQETELRRMLKLETPRATTTLVGGGSKLPTGMTGKIDDFDLLTELGRGAFACVYLARQVSMQRMVALKISADKGSEAQTLAQLDHPNIVRVYDQRSLPERRLRLIYMQYLAGGTLEAVHQQMQEVPPAEKHGRHFVKAVDKSLDDRGESAAADSTMREKLSSANWPEVVCWLGSRLAAALAYAHGVGVLHRDIKPANVLVAADGNPKLADFNISFSNKVEGATPAAYFGGSLAYMSPEQLEACNPAHDREPDSLDGRSDVYSLGVMLWELLTGSRPFPDERPSSNWSAQLTTMVARRTAGIDARTRSSLPVDCPPGLRDVLLKCLTADVDERFDAADAARQFEICLQPRAQKLLYPPTTKVRSFIQKHPALTTIIAIVLTHAVISSINIKFNANELLHHFGVDHDDWRWISQVVVVNIFSYSIGSYILLRLAWPVLKAAGAKPEPADRAEMAAIRSRSLKLGDYFAAVGITLWTASGIIFPICLALIAFKRPDFVFELSPVALFILSQLLFGVTAAALSYFIIVFLVVGYFYPRLLVRELAQPEEVSDLFTLKRRMWIYNILAVMVPFGAVVIWMTLSTNKDSQLLAPLLLGVGIIGYALCFALDRIVRDDVMALTQVVNPAGQTLAGGQTASDSFMTGSRR